MDKESLYAQIVADTERLGIMPFDPSLQSDLLMNNLRENWSALPDSTKSIMMDVAASLKKHHADGVISEHRAKQAVRRAQGRQ